MNWRVWRVVVFYVAPVTAWAVSMAVARWAAGSDMPVFPSLIVYWGGALAGAVVVMATPPP